MEHRTRGSERHITVYSGEFPLGISFADWGVGDKLMRGDMEALSPAAMFAARRTSSAAGIDSGDPGVAP
ncbi:MAG: hypothetical protein KC495_13735 [Dehalococcoidia bacterium]|nr:hypothetical protein [Dehalococcoidia bacterium]